VVELIAYWLSMVKVIFGTLFFIIITSTILILTAMHCEKWQGVSIEGIKLYTPLFDTVDDCNQYLKWYNLYLLFKYNNKVAPCFAKCMMIPLRVVLSKISGKVFIIQMAV